MEYGAQGLMWAKVLSEPEDSLPKYDAPINLGELVQVTTNPNFVEGKAAGDNDATARYIKRFRDCNVDVGVLDFQNEVASTIFGAEIDTAAQDDIAFSADDNPPYGGLAFYTVNLMKGNLVRYQGIFVPLLKASMTGKTYNTTGENLTLTSSAAQFLAKVCKLKRRWMIKSKFFETEAEAVAWRDAKLAGGTVEATDTVEAG